jgi:sulfatase maturation enzyme AslB (radical SAM superfamily)
MTMTAGALGSVVRHLTQWGVEIMWVGGEPTMNRHLHEAIKEAASLQLRQCLFTNGSILTEEQAASLFDAEIEFVRVSLNAVSTDTHQRHHAYPANRPFATRVLENLSTLADLRRSHPSRTEVGVSVVIDRTNIDDLEATLEHILAIGNPGIDFIVVREATPFHGSIVETNKEVHTRFESAMTGPTLQAIRANGIRVALPHQQFLRHEEARSGACRATGWFGEITPRGDLLACSDRYGDPDWIVGNIITDALPAIWASEERAQAIKLVSEKLCFLNSCPAGSRGHHLNTQFARIEELRASGNIHLVKKWIEDIRSTIEPPRHSGFL